MHVLFLDANVLFSAAYQEKSGILKLWSLSNVKLVSSAYAVEEAHRNLKTSTQRDHLDRLLKPMNIIKIEYEDELLPMNIILPSKDRPILAAAIAVSANYLITGDFKDFGRYFGKNIAGVTILPPAAYFNEVL